MLSFAKLTVSIARLMLIPPKSSRQPFKEAAEVFMKPSKR
jgi:hypothetical protein